VPVALPRVALVRPLRSSSARVSRGRGLLVGSPAGVRAVEARGGGSRPRLTRSGACGGRGAGPVGASAPPAWSVGGRAQWRLGTGRR